MNPAFSVVVFTVAAGAGQGLAVAVALALLIGGPIETPFVRVALAVAIVLLVVGLAASFFHLGRPARAWRAAAMWRTSWLSREVIVLPAFMAVTALYAAAHFLNWNGPYGSGEGGITDPTMLLGFAGFALAIILYLCTGMVYACLPFLREWATPLTVVNFTLLGLASGFALAAAATLARPPLVRVYAACALAFTIAGLLGRLAALARNARLRPKSTIQTAIGIKHPRIAQTSKGFSAGSFNTREFFHGRTRAFVRSVKWLFLLAGFVLPAALLALGIAGAPRATVIAAFVVQFAGLIAERWHFFAQANHPQNLYYQAVA